MIGGKCHGCDGRGWILVKEKIDKPSDFKMDLKAGEEAFTRMIELAKLQRIVIESAKAVLCPVCTGKGVAVPPRSPVNV